MRWDTDGDGRVDAGEAAKGTGMAFLIAIAAAVVLVVVGAIIYGVAYAVPNWQCHRYGGQQGYAAKYDIAQATCYLQVNGQWVDKDKFRVVDNGD